jgi:oligopeptide/dipeptide ABC transporter ATP-binding protein
MTTVLEVEGLTKRFPLRGRRGSVHAVSDVSLAVDEGESLGLVGESGSGKTTTGRCILRLLDPSSGSIRFRGVDLTAVSGKELRGLRRQLQVVFQEPYESLNPRLAVAQIVEEPLQLHRRDLSPAERRARVLELMDRVQLRRDLAGRRPDELSGGQQQRVGIARAIATDPEFVVLDEPTSSLDVSVRAQILELLLALQREQRLSYLFISHDLSTIQYSCQRVAVMYLGRIVEVGPTRAVFEDARHPYTRALLSSILRPTPGATRERIVLEGEVPSAVELPSGCPFASRCPLAIAACRAKRPELEPVDGAGHRVACIRADEVPTLMPKTGGRR